MTRLAAALLAIAVAVLTLLVGVPVVAADPAGPLPLDLVSVSEIQDLSPEVAGAAASAATDAGGRSVVLDGGSLKMVRVWRGQTLVQGAPLRYAFPMAWAAGDADSLGALRGPEVGAALAAGQLVMGRTTAGLRGARAGDVVELYGWNGRPARLTIGLVADDAAMGGAELLLSTAVATPLGLVRPSRVVLWGAGREALQAALEAHGLVRSDVRIRHSWDPPDPDGELSAAMTKVLFGEFAYRTVGTRVVVQSSWVRRNLPRNREQLGTAIPVVARCHVALRAALAGALAEVAATGLASAIDVADTNRSGGCFNARLVRSLGGDVGGQLSRHTWAMAIDVNVQTNKQGAEPRMDCGVVRIFRKWGFAWGGNFVVPDGMHFEYAGGRRDLMAYPSARCPNDPGAAPPG